MQLISNFTRRYRWLAVAIVGLSAIQVAGCRDNIRDGFYAFDDDTFGYYRARRDSITPGVGNSVAHNIAVQTIDPWPNHARNTKIDMDGERALIAIDRYKANKSIEPKGLDTQQVNTENGLNR